MLDRPRFEIELVVESDGGGRVALTEAELIKQSDEPRADSLRFAATQLRRGNAGIVANDDLIATGEPGTVSYGPLLTLARGSYTCSWFGRGVPSSGRISFSVRADGDRKVLARSDVAASTLASGKLVELDFSLDRPRDGIEFIVESIDGARVMLDHVLITPAHE